MSQSHALRYLSTDGPLERAAWRSDEVASRWQALLTADDRVALIQGFHAAESLAGHAIDQARQQLPARYHAGLDAQAADEIRHIAVFSSWLGEAPEVPAPRVRERQHAQWLALLLVNELTGFCQFRMLARLVDAPEARDAIDAISADERVHIARLLDWLEPMWGTRSVRPLGEFFLRFRRDLPGRMCQFFPRAALEPLRDEMVEVIDELLAALPKP